MDDPGNLRSTYKASTRSKHSNRSPNSYPTNSNYHDEEEDEYEGDELGEEDEEEINNEFEEQDDEDNDVEEEEEQEEQEEEQEEEEQEDFENGYDDSKRRPKKRRIESLVSNYEFAPRKPSNSPAEWTDHSTFLLLEAWGDRFMQLGRKSLRSEDWQEVAEKVSEGSKVEWTDAQCRNRLDLLKKKYKKEREKMEAMGVEGYNGKWGFFKKMDMLLNSSSVREQHGLPCGIDSGEYVFMNPRVYLNRSNGLDEMRDSPDQSESFEDNEDDNGLPPKRDGSSFGLLADSVKKFGEIYEKIESSKRQQMMELEKMRVDFQRELEVQKNQILERAQAEIAKIRGGDDDDDETDVSAENFSG